MPGKFQVCCNKRPVETLRQGKITAILKGMMNIKRDFRCQRNKILYFAQDRYPQLKIISPLTHCPQNSFSTEKPMAIFSRERSSNFDANQFGSKQGFASAFKARKRTLVPSFRHKPFHRNAGIDDHQRRGLSRISRISGVESGYCLPPFISSNTLCNWRERSAQARYTACSSGVRGTSHATLCTCGEAIVFCGNVWSSILERYLFLNCKTSPGCLGSPNRQTGKYRDYSPPLTTAISGASAAFIPTT